VETLCDQLLVVEDNPDSRDLLCEMLAMLGYETQAAASAEEAMELLDKTPFDVLFVDINLPGMSGIELAKMAVNKAPDLKIIFASGYGFLVTDKTDFRFALLPKPYTLAQVQQAIKAVYQTA
jgi:CheY-like chemotaxis protein